MSSTSAPRRRAIPARIGSYTVVRPIGSGGTATVYLATRGGGEPVALKLVHAHLRDDPNVARDFLEEAKLTARLDHPGIVPVIDLGEADEGIFLAMEYVDGVTLSAMQRHALAHGGPLSPEITLALLSDALAALHHAHELRDEKGAPLLLVHRDFSPQNILVGRDGRARLTDFGIARALDRPGFTLDGLVKGKAGYMAPEQAMGGPIDRRCDVWAAGAVAWELFAGRPLFDGEPMQRMLAVTTRDALPLRAVRADLPEALSAVLSRALAREPKERFATAQELQERLVDAARPHFFPADRRLVAPAVEEVLAAQAEAAAALGACLDDSAATALAVPFRGRSRRFGAVAAVGLLVAGAASIAAARLAFPARAPDGVAVRASEDAGTGGAGPLLSSIPSGAAEEPTGSAPDGGEPEREAPGSASVVARAIPYAAGTTQVAPAPPSGAGTADAARATTSGAGTAEVARATTSGAGTGARPPIAAPIPTKPSANHPWRLKVTADKPFRRLVVGGRPVRLAAPTRSIVVPFAERRSSVVIEATSVDGRKTRRTAMGSAPAIQLSFDEPPRGAESPPLADNPYEQ